MDDNIKCAIVTVGVFIFIAIIIMIEINYDSLASENALQQCLDRGFDSYSDYNLRPFSITAYGVRCNYIENRKEIVTSSDNVITGVMVRWLDYE